MPSRKGSPNKLGAAAKDNIAAVFVRLGGTAAMAKWAEANQTDFYRIYSKLVPAGTVLTDADGEPLEVTFRIGLGSQDRG